MGAATTTKVRPLITVLRAVFWMAWLFPFCLALHQVWALIIFRPHSDADNWMAAAHHMGLAYYGLWTAVYCGLLICYWFLGRLIQRLSRRYVAVYVRIQSLCGAIVLGLALAYIVFDAIATRRLQAEENAVYNNMLLEREGAKHH